MSLGRCGGDPGGVAGQGVRQQVESEMGSRTIGRERVL